MDVCLISADLDFIPYILVKLSSSIVVEKEDQQKVAEVRKESVTSVYF